MRQQDCWPLFPFTYWLVLLCCCDIIIWITQLHEYACSLTSHLHCSSKWAWNVCVEMLIRAFGKRDGEKIQNDSSWHATSSCLLYRQPRFLTVNHFSATIILSQFRHIIQFSLLCLFFLLRFQLNSTADEAFWWLFIRNSRKLIELVLNLPLSSHVSVRDWN